MGQRSLLTNQYSRSDEMLRSWGRQREPFDNLLQARFRVAPPKVSLRLSPVLGRTLAKGVVVRDAEIEQLSTVEPHAVG